MKRIIKLITALLVVAITFTKTGTSSYAYYVTSQNYNNITYTPTYSFSSSKVPEIKDQFLRDNSSAASKSYNPLKLRFSKVNGTISVGNVLGMFYKPVGKNQEDIKNYLYSANLMPQILQFVDANGKPLCGTKYPIVDNIDPITCTQEFRVSDNALFRDVEIERILITANTTSGVFNGTYKVEIEYWIPDYAVMNGYEVKLGNYTPSPSSKYSYYFKNPNYWQYPNIEYSTYGEVEFILPLKQLKGKSFDLTFNGVKVTTLTVN